jgi:hypothetical protein
LAALMTQQQPPRPLTPLHWRLLKEVDEMLASLKRALDAGDEAEAARLMVAAATRLAAIDALRAMEDASRRSASHQPSSDQIH